MHLTEIVDIEFQNLKVESIRKIVFFLILALVFISILQKGLVKIKLLISVYYKYRKHVKNYS